MARSGSILVAGNGFLEIEKGAGHGCGRGKIDGVDFFGGQSEADGDEFFGSDNTIATKNLAG